MEGQNLSQSTKVVSKGSKVLRNLFKFFLLTIIFVVFSLLLKDPISDYISSIKESLGEEPLIRPESTTETKTIREYITEFKEGEEVAYTPSIQISGEVIHEDLTQIPETGEGDWVSIEGDIMTGDLVMSGSDIEIDGNNIVTSEYTVTSVELDILADGIELNELGKLGDDQIGDGVVDLDSDEVAGILPIRRGGTNAWNFTSGSFIWYDGTRLTSSGYTNASFFASGTDNWVNTTGDAMTADLTMGSGSNIVVGGSGNLLLGSTYLNETSGTTDSGAYLVGSYDEFGNSNSTTVQDVLDDLDQALTDLGVLGILPDSLDFSEFEDSMDLDASTTVVFGTNNYVLNLNNSGDLVIRDNGTPFATFADGGYLDLDNLRLNANTLSSTSGGVTLTATDSNIVLSSQADAANEAVRADRSVSAGNGLSGGGDFTTNRSLSVNQGYGFSWTGNNSWGTGSATFNNRPAFNGGDGSFSPFTVDSNYLVSSLNADLLDGSESTAFMSASTDDWVDEVGDSMGGTLTFSGVATDITVTSGEALSLSAPGAQHIVLSPDSGNVGIVTTTPDYKLTVEGQAAIADNEGAVDSNGTLYLGRNSSAWESLAWNDTNDRFEFSDDLYASSFVTGTSLTIHDDYLLDTGDINLQADNDSSNYLTISTGTEVGTETVSALYWQGILSYSNDPGFSINDSGEIVYRDGDEPGWTTLDSLVVGSSWQLTGNIVNPTQATYDLAVGGTAVDSSMFGIDESAGNFYFGYDNSANPTFLFESIGGTPETGTFGFNDNDAFYFSDANLGVGTSNPSDFTLQVNGSIGPDSAPSPGTVSQSITTVDSTGDVGISNSLAIGSDGLPVIAYFDDTNDNLKVFKCGNLDCSSGNTISTVTSTGGISHSGFQISMAIGRDTYPVIAYNYVAGSELRVAKCNDPACSDGDETISTVDSLTLYQPALAISDDGTPVISYCDTTVDGDLKVAKCNDTACSGGDETITVVDSIDTTGIDSAITIGTDGLPIITYSNGTTGYLFVVKCGNTSCSSGNTITNLAVQGYDSAIEIGTDALPVISFQGAFALTLHVMKCGNTSCSSGNTVTVVDSDWNTGKWNSLAIGTDGIPVISYLYAGGSWYSLRFLRCGNSSCFSGNTIFTIDGDYVGSLTGRHSSLAIGNDGIPIIAYGHYDSVSTYDLKVAQVAGSSWTGGSDIGSREKFFNNVYATTYWAKEDMQISNFDLAEDYRAIDPSIVAGDVVATASDSNIAIDKTKFAYQNNVIGVVSTRPGIQFTDWDLPEEERELMRPVALSGRVPVKVTTENGPIKKDDFLVPSSKPGYAMKACGTKYCQAGTVIGKALEDFDPDQSGDSGQVTYELEETKQEVAEEFPAYNLQPTVSSQEEIKEELSVISSQLSEGSKLTTDNYKLKTEIEEQVETLTKPIDSHYGEGRIMMFINLGWYSPPNPLNSLSSMSSDFLWSGNLDTTNNSLAIATLRADKGIFNQLEADYMNVSKLGVTGLLTTEEIRAGVLKAYEGKDIVVGLSESMGETAFEIENSIGEVVFSVDSEGKVGGAGVFESDWVSVESNSKVSIKHNLGHIPRDISLLGAEDPSGSITSSRGLGRTEGYYYEDLNEDSITVVNGSRKKIYIKVYLRK